MPNYALLHSALKAKKIITFSYEDRERECEIHVIGMANGVEQVLCYQISGSSQRGGIPQWRRFEVSGISDLKLTNDKFDGKRPVPHPHSLGWDQIFAVVD